MLRRLVLVLLAMVAMCAGLSLGAQIQDTTILRPQQALADGDDVILSGQLVIVTGLLVATGAALLCLAFYQGNWLRKLGLALGAFMLAWMLVVSVQTIWPNYQEIDSANQRYAELTITPFWSNGAGNPGLLLLPIAGIMSMCLGVAALLVTRRKVDTVHEQRGRLLFAAPFLMIGTFAPIRLLSELPPSDPRGTMYFAVWPLMSLCFAGLLIVGILQYHSRARGATFTQMSMVSSEQDRVLRIAMAVLGGVILLAGLAASFLPPLALAALNENPTLLMTARAFTQLGSLAAFTALPMVLLPYQDGPTESRRHEFVMSCLALGMVGAGVLTWYPGNTLYAWLVAALACAAATVGARATRWTILPMLLLALILWGFGNSVHASFDAKEDIRLNYEYGPALLSFLRTLAVVAFAWAVTRAARAVSRTQAVGTMPLSIGVGTCFALAALIWLSVGAWIMGARQDSIGLGPIITSQSGPVRVILHVIASAAFASGLLMLYALRCPADWKAKTKALEGE